MIYTRIKNNALQKEVKGWEVCAREILAYETILNTERCLRREIITWQIQLSFGSFQGTEVCEQAA